MDKEREIFQFVYTLVSGQRYLRPPCAKPRFNLKSLYFYILVIGHPKENPIDNLSVLFLSIKFTWTFVTMIL